MIHLFLALLPLTETPVPESPSIQRTLGVNTHLAGAAARDLDLIRDAGLGWIRNDLVWGVVEREKGVHRFEPYDELLEGLTDRGLGAILVLAYSNGAYEKERSVRTPEGRAAFARFAAAAAARYRGRLIRWEIWNEPDHEQFWLPAPDPAEYAALALEAAKAIREADPGAVILAPASSSFPWRFLESVFEKGLLDVIDEVSVHPYRVIAPESVRDDYALLRDIMEKHSRKRPGPPIVSSEWGYSNHHWGVPIPEDLQAAYAVRMFLTNLAYGVRLSIWYDWANDGPDARNTEHNFGLVTGDREPKEAYRAVRTLTSVIGRRAFLRRIQVAQEDHLLLFGAAGEPLLLAAWTGGRPHNITLRAGDAARARIVGMTGDEDILESTADGSFSVPLLPSPTYIELPPKTSDLVVHAMELDPTEQALIVTLIRTGAGRRSATLGVAWGSATARHPVMLDPADISKVELPVAWPIDSPLPVSAELHDAESGELLAAAPRAAFAAIPSFMEDWVQAAGSLRNFQADLEGGAAGRGQAWLTRRRGAPDASASSSEPKAISCSYRLEGGKYLRIVPVTRRDIPGKPSALLVAVNGDASGSRVRCRVKDAKDEVFQPEGIAVSWKGWKQIRLPVDGRESRHWGGNKDGVLDYPITWDSIFLVEAPPGGSSGSLDFRFPLLVYHAE
jgi:hypothetical protein